MNDTTDPMEPIRRLGERLAEVVAPLGFEMEVFDISPGFNGTPPHAKVLFLINVDDVGKDAAAKQEQATVDKEFEAIARSFKSSELEEKEADAERKLRERLERWGDGGVLGDEPT